MSENLSIFSLYIFYHYSKSSAIIATILFAITFAKLLLTDTIVITWDIAKANWRALGDIFVLFLFVGHILWFWGLFLLALCLEVVPYCAWGMICYWGSDSGIPMLCMSSALWVISSGFGLRFSEKNHFCIIEVILIYITVCTLGVMGGLPKSCKGFFPNIYAP